MLWEVITAKRSKIEPGQNLLEAVKVRSKIGSFFVKNPNFKISQKKFLLNIQQASKTHKCYFNEFFVGRTIWSAELKIDFGLLGGQKTLDIHFSPQGGRRSIKLGSWMMGRWTFKMSHLPSGSAGTHVPPFPRYGVLALLNTALSIYSIVSAVFPIPQAQGTIPLILTYTMLYKLDIW